MVFKHNFKIIISTFLFLFLIGFLGSGVYYLLAVTDDKMYDDNNKYIDDTLTGDSLTAQSNIKDAYKLNQESSDWIFIVIKFISVILKVAIILTIPIMIYFFFINKKHSIINKLSKMFNK